MKRAEITERIKSAFQSHYDRLVEVLVDDYIGDPAKVDEFISYFWHGVKSHSDLESRVTETIASKFPE
jgi:hypothetical protein